MKLIIGLGNPEERYKDTRHNVGFRILDSYAKRRDASFLHKDKFKALTAEFPSSGIILAKPSTYYNLSGEAVQALANFYNVEPENILVIHDELDLPFGTIRTREKGGDAGNNGMKSIIQHLGPTTKRIRIGTKNDLHEFMDSADFVLGKFKPAEKEIFEKDIAPIVFEQIERFLDGSFQATKITLKPTA